jgi:hypothetical protein
VNQSKVAIVPGVHADLGAHLGRLSVVVDLIEEDVDERIFEDDLANATGKR